jgi:hypothetical protein
VFRNKRGDRLKILARRGDGISLYLRRSEKGTFAVPEADTDEVSVTATELAMILGGVELGSAKKQPRVVSGSRLPHGFRDRHLEDVAFAQRRCRWERGVGFLGSLVFAATRRGDRISHGIDPSSQGSVSTSALHRPRQLQRQSSPRLSNLAGRKAEEDENRLENRILERWQSG